MIRTVDLRGRSLSKAQYNSELPRATLNVAEAMVLIEPILERVKHGTEEDLIALAQEFDGVRPQSIRVPQSALTDALSQLDPAIRTALELSISRITKVHIDQLRTSTTTNVVDGGTEFKYQKIILNAEKGNLIIWPADFTHTHKGIISNTKEKYIATGWFEIDS